MGMPKWIIEFKFLSGPERERGSTSHSLFYLLPSLIPFEVRVEGRERDCKMAAAVRGSENLLASEYKFNSIKTASCQWCVACCHSSSRPFKIE